MHVFRFRPSPLFVAALALAFLCPFLVTGSAVRAQAPRSADGKQTSPLRPSFSGTLQLIGTPLSGPVALRVVALSQPSASRWPLIGKNNKVGEIRLDGLPLTLFDRMPYEMAWDTTRTTNGPHLLTLVLLDTNTNQATVLERVPVTVANRPSNLAKVFGPPVPLPVQKSTLPFVVRQESGHARRKANTPLFPPLCPTRHR